MRRRDFLAAGLAAAPVSSVPPRRRRSRRRGTIRQRGIRLLVRVPAGWQPRTWRDVPPAESVVVAVGLPCSLAAARQTAKAFNRAVLTRGGRRWAVVAITDGRCEALPKAVPHE